MTHEPLRIGVDATSVSPAGKGISRVQAKAVELVAGLGQAYEVVAYIRGSAAAVSLAGAGAKQVVDLGPGRALAWEQVGMPRRFARDGLAVLLTTTDRLPLWGRGRYIVWLFELPIHRIEHNRRQRVRTYERLSDLITLAVWKRSLRRAAVLVAASQATAAELAHVLPDVAARIRVVYPGIDGFSPGAASRKTPYLFHLSSSDPRDNTETVLAAYARLRARVPAAPVLVLAGGLGAREAPIGGEIARLGLAGSVEVLGRVSDEELVDLYRGATAYVDASLFEGFGYQVLEAMACGAPVVASNVTSIPELTGDAALLCEPDSSEQFADALARVIEEPGLAERLRGAGPARAREFTWQASARGLRAVFDEVLG